MARVKNPFVVTGKIEREYFCDRVEESRKIVKSINNGNNIVLISPRRMGKTGLMRYCYDFEFGKDEYYTEPFDLPDVAWQENIRNSIAQEQEDDDGFHTYS